MPADWAHSWVRNLRIIIGYHYPYVWGGESQEEGGYDCTGFLYAGRPLAIKNKQWISQLQADVKRPTTLKRSTSARMQRGLDGWISVPTSSWNVREMDLGFIPGHAFAIARGKSGLRVILHSTSSRGPIEQPLPSWVAAKHPVYKHLTIGDK